MSNCSCKWGGCACSKICFILLAIGGINWGLIGVGTFISQDLNIVKMLLGSMPMVEAIIYVLVGIAAVMKLIGCKCSKCKNACTTCATCPVDSGTKTGDSMM